MAFLLIGSVYVRAEVLFHGNNLEILLKQMHLPELGGEGRVMDDMRNALGRQTPLPLICRTALSVSVCMATSAPPITHLAATYYQFVYEGLCL